MDVTRNLTIRLARPGDTEALRRLADLDSAMPPSGKVLVAEHDGELVAALPAAGGPAIADPFRHTAAIVQLLELRRAQLAAAPRRGLRRAAPWRVAARHATIA
jgi:hypothetical protein